ncbi:MAG: tRNA-dihydrouridine synthase, partial [Bacillota bacterium]|nr:tRNA-dihydrouridine synthase [Bacillota bacterium]
GEIVKEVSKASDKPVTVKIRKGWDDTRVNAVEIASIAVENGAKAVAVHGRTRDQFYSGKADWDIIKKVKEAVPVPVIGNGDIFKPEDARDILEQTGCDAIMIGRGAQGNPWIFKRTLHYLETGILLPLPSAEEKVNMVIRHAKMLVSLKGEYTGVNEMRKHIAWYIKGIRNAAKVRDMIFKTTSLEDTINIMRLMLEASEKDLDIDL